MLKNHGRPAPQRWLAAALCAALAVAAPGPLAAQAAAQIVGSAGLGSPSSGRAARAAPVGNSLGLPAVGSLAPAPLTASAIPARAAEFTHPSVAGPVAALGIFTQSGCHHDAAKGMALRHVAMGLYRLA